MAGSATNGAGRNLSIFQCKKEDDAIGRRIILVINQLEREGGGEACDVAGVAAPNADGCGIQNTANAVDFIEFGEFGMPLERTRGSPCNSNAGLP
ncbi:hypothetical protein PIB30_057951 [Stylosanthes scabra]|uniref:Uncharacterized protein n=1 Tax=Stylosanthes scabra TaxID=79078 RepID=A0ABU6XHT0_9FABA|nr:hypothetical protein [Stylosanthes scabra]